MGYMHVSLLLRNYGYIEGQETWPAADLKGHKQSDMTKDWVTEQQQKQHLFCPFFSQLEAKALPWSLGSYADTCKWVKEDRLSVSSLPEQSQVFHRGTLATDLLPGQWGGHTTHAWALGTVLDAFHKLTHLIFTITLGNSFSSEDKCTLV